MTTLHLGVNDVPYTKYNLGKTTGDVAQILEAKYGIMAAFVSIREGAILNAIEGGIAKTLETALIRGGRLPKGGPLAGAMSAIEHDFKQALAMQMLDGKIPGVPTAAALRGVSHRFKRPYVRRPQRPSFIDTGLYQSSFRAWVD